MLLGSLEMEKALFRISSFPGDFYRLAQAARLGKVAGKSGRWAAAKAGDFDSQAEQLQ